MRTFKTHSNTKNRRTETSDLVNCSSYLQAFEHFKCAFALLWCIYFNDMCQLGNYALNFKLHKQKPYNLRDEKFVMT